MVHIIFLLNWKYLFIAHASTSLSRYAYDIPTFITEVLCLSETNGARIALLGSYVLRYSGHDRA